MKNEQLENMVVKKCSTSFFSGILSKLQKMIRGRFRIRISSSWFSNDFIVLRYSTNGIFWKSVKEYEYDSYYEWCYMVSLTRRFQESEYLLEKFNTLEKIKQYESKQREKVKNENAKISDKNRKNKENRKNIYKKYG
jgi:hypothetical protein